MPDPHPSSLDRSSSSTPKRSRLPGWLMALMALAVIVIAIITWATSRMFASPNPKTDYAAELVKLSEEAQPPGSENAWPLLISAGDKASQAVDSHSTSDTGVDIDAALRGSWDPQASALALATLSDARAAGAFDDLARAAAMPRAIRPPLVPQPPLADALFPELAPFRKLAKLSALDMRRAFEEKHFADIPPQVTSMLALARHTSFQPTVIHGLVAYSVQAMLYGEIRYELLDGGYDEATCRALQNLLGSSPPMAPYSFLVHSSRIDMLDRIQLAFTDDGNGDGRLIPSQFFWLKAGGAGPPSQGFGAMRVMNVMPTSHPSRKDTVATLDRVIDRLCQLSEMAPVARVAEHFSLVVELTPLWDGGTHQDNILSQFIDPLDKLNQHRDMLHTESAATRLMLALHIYKLRHNAYPASLSDLVPDILPAPILDPLNNLPFGYRLLTDDPQNRPYLLYSLGLDGLDQQGAMPDLKKYKPDDPTLPDTRKAMTELIPFDSVIDAVRPPR